MSFAETYDGSRRVFLLRTLIEVGGSANASVLRSAAQAGGFARTTSDDIGADLNHLHARGCITEAWHGPVRVATATERGEDCAYGRVAVDGVENSIWRR